MLTSNSRGVEPTSSLVAMGPTVAMVPMVAENCSLMALRGTRLMATKQMRCCKAALGLDWPAPLLVAAPRTASRPEPARTAVDRACRGLDWPAPSLVAAPRTASPGIAWLVAAPRTASPSSPNHACRIAGAWTGQHPRQLQRHERHRLHRQETYPKSPGRRSGNAGIVLVAGAWAGQYPSRITAWSRKS